MTIELDYDDEARDWPKRRTLDLPDEADDPEALAATLREQGFTQAHARRLVLNNPDLRRRYPALDAAIRRLPRK